MSDARLRELERRAAQTGALEDQVAVLACRLRVGELQPIDLQTWAALGHAAAKLATGLPAGWEPDTETWRELVCRTRALGARAAWLACAEMQRTIDGTADLNPHLVGLLSPADDELTELLRVAARALSAPTPRDLLQAREGVTRATAVARRLGRGGLRVCGYGQDPGPDRSLMAPAHAVREMMRGVTFRGDRPALRACGRALLLAEEVFTECTASAWLASPQARPPSADSPEEIAAWRAAAQEQRTLVASHLRRVVSDRLRPWVCDADPLDPVIRFPA